MSVEEKNWRFTMIRIPARSDFLWPRVNLYRFCPGAIIALISLWSLATPARSEPSNYRRAAEPPVKQAFLPLPPGRRGAGRVAPRLGPGGRHGITGHLDEYHPTFHDAWKGTPVAAPGQRPMEPVGRWSSVPIGLTERSVSVSYCTTMRW